MNDTPSVDFATCDGCGLCISACPGLAIFVVDARPGSDTAKVSLPYEYCPSLPSATRSQRCRREGDVLGEGTVERVLTAKALDRTPIVTLAVPAEHAMDVRHFLAKDANV